jgi:serine/threonine-protein kinase
VVATEDGSLVTETDASGGGFRFVRPIRYAGANFGRVDLLLRRTSLVAAEQSSRMLLLALSGFVMLVVMLIGWLCANRIEAPIRRVRRALEDAATGDLSFRISHRRSDEFGALFDAFNNAAQALETDRPHSVFRELGPLLTETLVAPRQAA